jgi:hypothetical protein
LFSQQKKFHKYIGRQNAPIIFALDFFCYLLGLYQIQSLTGNPSGSFQKVSAKELPKQIDEVCQKNPQANVGDIAIAIKSALDKAL